MSWLHVQLLTRHQIHIVAGESGAFMVSCTSNAGIRNCNLNVFQALRAIELFDRHGTSLSSSYDDYENSFDKVWVEFLAQGSFHDGLSSMENKVSRMIGWAASIVWFQLSILTYT